MTTASAGVGPALPALDQGTVHEFKRSQHSPLTHAEKDKVIQLYRDLVPVGQIGQQLRGDRRTVRGIAKRAGLNRVLVD